MVQRAEERGPAEAATSREVRAQFRFTCAEHYFRVVGCALHCVHYVVWFLQWCCESEWGQRSTPDRASKSSRRCCLPSLGVSTRPSTNWYVRLGCEFVMFCGWQRQLKFVNCLCVRRTKILLVQLQRRKCVFCFQPLFSVNQRSCIYRTMQIRLLW